MTSRDRHDELVALLTEIRDRLPEYVNPTLDWLDEPTPVPRPEPKGTAAASAPLRPGEYILNRDGSAYRVVGTSEPGGDDEAQEDPDETHPMPCNACYGSGSAEIQEQVAEDVDRLRAERDECRVELGQRLALIEKAERRAVKAEAERDAYKRAKAENDERFQLEAAEQRERAEKAEADVLKWKREYASAERDRARADLRTDKAEAEVIGWKAKYAAFRADVEGLRYLYMEGGKATTVRYYDAGRQIETAILDRDDARTPQADAMEADQ